MQDVVTASRSFDKVTYEAIVPSGQGFSIKPILYDLGISTWSIGVDFFSDIEASQPIGSNGDFSGETFIYAITTETISRVPASDKGGKIDNSSTVDRRIELLACCEEIVIEPSSVPSGAFMRVRATGRF